MGLFCRCFQQLDSPTFLQQQLNKKHQVSNQVRNKVSIQDVDFFIGIRKSAKKLATTKFKESTGLTVVLDHEKNDHIIFSRKLKFQEKNMFQAPKIGFDVLLCHNISYLEWHEKQLKLSFQKRIGMVINQVRNKVSIQDVDFFKGIRKSARKLATTKIKESTGLTIVLNYEKNDHIIFAKKLKFQENNMFQATKIGLDVLPCHNISYLEWHEKQLKLSSQKRIVMDLKSFLKVLKDEVQRFQEEAQRFSAKFEKQMLQLESWSQGCTTTRLVEEDKKLHKELQKHRGNIRIYCRIKPTLLQQEIIGFSTSFLRNKAILTIEDPTKFGKQMRNMFVFNKIFGPSATQGDIFLEIQPLFKSILDGSNVCIFAYGQTSSGKTYTMSGPTAFRDETCGLNYRSMKELFEICAQKNDSVSYKVSIQMIEIYNEQVRDLLTADFRHRSDSCIQNGVGIPATKIVHVESVLDAIKLVEMGDKKRVIASTIQNDHSSRSHRILTVHVEGRSLMCNSFHHGCLHLVDLAGSERIQKVGTTGIRLEETKHINKSLSALGDVFSALSHRNSHVPYRNSMLTRILKDSLGGQAEVVMFAHINPEQKSYWETFSTLTFSDRVSTIQLGASHLKQHPKKVEDSRE